MGIGSSAESTIIRYAKDDDRDGLTTALEKNPGHVNAADADGQTALIHATKSCNTYCVRTLLEHKADPNLVSTPHSTGQLPHRKGFTALHASLEGGNAVIPLLEAAADPNVKDSAGQTPLYYAVTDGHFQPALTLLNTGANAALCGPSIIHEAVYCNRYTSGYSIERFSELIPKLVEKGANPNGLWEPDARSSWSGSPPRMDPLGAVTPLFWALHCRRCTVAILQVLVDNGADPTMRNAQGKSGLFEAVMVVHMHGVESIALVEFFIAQGCDRHEVSMSK